MSDFNLEELKQEIRLQDKESYKRRIRAALYTKGFCLPYTHSWLHFNLAKNFPRTNARTISQYRVCQKCGKAQDLHQGDNKWRTRKDTAILVTAPVFSKEELEHDFIQD